MKIAFLTSSLEPGRDGAGDYTTLLAEESARRGHSVCRLALNDRFASESREPHLLRLGSPLTWSRRVSLARDFLREFAPDFVSVQFVCYGFHPRGLGLAVPARLRAIIGTVPVHLMLHELWIGMEEGASLKHRLIGSVQRHGVVQLVKQLRPRVIHTSIPAYVHLLRRRGVSAGRLPLFGNVPVAHLATEVAPPREKWTFAMFGTLHPVWPPEPLLSQLRALDRPVEITHIGRIGAGAELWETMVARYGDGIGFKRLGEQPLHKISELFAASHFGIATTPWALVGKSGTVAAMLDHGLPVIVNRDDVRFTGQQDAILDDPLLVRMSDDLPAQLRAVSRRPAHLRLAEVAAEFLALLEAALAR